MSRSAGGHGNSSGAVKADAVAAERAVFARPRFV